MTSSVQIHSKIMSNQYFHDNGLPKIGLLCEPYMTPVRPSEPLRAFTSSMNTQHCHSCLSIAERPEEHSYFCVLKKNSLPIVPPMSSNNRLENIDWVTHMIWHNPDVLNNNPIKLAKEALTKVIFKLCPTCHNKADQLYRSHEVKPDSSYLVVGTSWDDMAHSLASYCRKFR